MMDKVARAESTAFPGQESMAGRDVDRRKKSSEPLMERIDQVAERVDRVVERMDRVVERLELLEQLVKKNSVPEGKIQS